MDCRLTQWLVLHHLPAMSHRYFLALLDVYGEPADILRTDPAVLLKVGMPETLADALADYQKHEQTSAAWQAVEVSLEWQAKDQANHILYLHSPDYPAQLKQIADPPALLFVKGNPASLHDPQIALVGSRKASAGGRRSARRFASALAAAGMTITSGMALGIDGESHQGALDVSGNSVAVLGSGLGQIYPRRHRRLASRIAETGALVSEFPLPAVPLAWRFPLRNRVISGLSLATVVIEAALRSGSLITARLALEQGRDVFAIPGNIDNVMVRGCHQLIGQGAMLADTPQSILEELAPQMSSKSRQPCSTAVTQSRPEDRITAKIFAHIGYDRVGLDQLLLESGLDVNTVTGKLTELELAGYIIAENGGYTRAC